MNSYKPIEPSEEPVKEKEIKTLEELIAEVRPPELSKEIKAAVKKAIEGENDGYPKLSRE
jgi:hypothetical protein